MNDELGTGCWEPEGVLRDLAPTNAVAPIRALRIDPLGILTSDDEKIPDWIKKVGGAGQVEKPRRQDSTLRPEGVRPKPP